MEEEMEHNTTVESLEPEVQVKVEIEGREYHK